MDSEAAVIRAEMSATRAALDDKLARLETYARDLPRRVMPEFLMDRVLGALLTFTGAMMAVRQLRARGNRRDRVRAELLASSRW